MRLSIFAHCFVLFVYTILCQGLQIPLVRENLNRKGVPRARPQRDTTITALNLLPGSSYPFIQEAVVVNGAIASLLALTQQKSLTRAGLVHSTALGVGLWTFLDFQGWLVCASYLVLGSVVTKIRMKEKEKLGIAEKRGGARGPENVWGSAATVRKLMLATVLV